MIVCVTEDTMTKAERRLVQEGEDELVVTIQRSRRRERLRRRGLPARRTPEGVVEGRQ